ncbi:uncharacterized protein SPAPADRAFT_59317 [Spathaspora passalidarum NRRL Y-27907]|uniref:Uncharacterized protein n=1 Tax=Spathaspora passalidarum (strain NRRL Y-27907 / 11-Y1) TaxID=619300 RepID=G3AJN2_SPAPN|nr:uncharacterized protein SPAPADRAFT_59317 [Spathaspora passalidarum NRRL Y-27907]EGW33933.1 hypothetical protein SPAPADRAFT_59317 [Spathaspora passalidarum NRRL Y-27907]
MIPQNFNIVTNAIVFVLAVTGPWIWVRMHQTNEIEVLQQLLRDGLFPVTIPIAIQFAGDVSFTFPDLIEATQFQIDREVSHLTNSSLYIQLIDNFDDSSPSLYSIDLILNNENTLGISATSLKGYVFYTLDSVHSNDLPFVITQTILYHLIRPEIDLMNRPLTENFPDSLDIKLKFNVHNETVQHNVTEFMDKMKQKLVGISVMNWEVDNSLTTRDNATLSVKFSGQNSSIIISPESDPVAELSMILQEQLNFPKYPKHNIYLKIEAAYRIKTLQILQELTDKIRNKNPSQLLQNLVHQIISETSPSWIGYLTTARQLLDSL